MDADSFRTPDGRRVPAITAEEFSENQDADLRGEVLPRYYGTLVGLFCRYLEDAPDPEVGIWLEDEAR